MKNNKTKIIILGIVAVVCVAAIIAFVVFFLPKMMNAEPTASPDQAIEKATIKATADEISTSEKNKITENETNVEPESTEAKPAIQAPDDMVNLLSNNNNTIDDLSDIGCKQLITVSSNGFNAHIDFYELNESKWTLDERLSCEGFVGSNGVTSDMHEGGYASPRGLYPVSDAFYIYEKPETGLNTFEVTNDTYWVDDPDSKYYNKRVEGTSDKDWNSAEHMIDYTTAYEYGFVIDYNHDAVYNAGSAIFFHVSYSSTAGCVGTDRDMVLQYLAKLDSNRNPFILIL